MNAEKAVCRVMVVDDDPHLLNLLELRLQEQGFAVTVASSAQQALEKVNDKIPDIVIADIMMPGMDGYELCERIRQNEKLRNIPFVFLSALADTQDKVKGLRLGADDYLTKPFEFRELLARIEILLDRYSRYQETFVQEEGGEEIATGGKIEDLGVIDLLQMLSFGQKTGEVHLESKGEKGVFYLMAGKLIAATYGNKHGLAALPVLLSWSEGRFSVKLTDSLSVIPTIENQTDEAIFEALRELDEAERIKQELDTALAPRMVNSPQPQDQVENELIELVDGQRSIAGILAESSQADFALLEKIRQWLGEGVLEFQEKEEIVEDTVSGEAKPEPALAAEPEAKKRIPDIPPDTEPRTFNLIVIGADREARNTFIHSVAGGEGEQDQEKVLNFGTRSWGPHRINLYGLPGAKRFAPLWQTFIQRVEGLILLADAGSDEEVENLRFALALLGPRIPGPKVIINTDPTKPEISPDQEAYGAQPAACLPTDREKAEEILSQILSQFIR